MKKLLLVLLILFQLGCKPVENTARDAIATASGVIASAQKQAHDSCVANPTQKICVAINKAIDANNVAIDALNVYCSGGNYSTGGTCTSNKNAQSALTAALNGLNQTITDVKGLVGK